MRKNHNWEYKQVEGDADSHYIACSRCGIDEDLALYEDSVICLRFSWLVHLKSKMRCKRRAFFRRLGALILRLSR